MSDLFVSAFSPTLDSGRALRSYSVVRALAALGPVDLVYAAFGGEVAPEYRAIAGLTLHPCLPSRGPRRAVAYTRARTRGVPDGFARAVSPELAARAGELAAAPGRGRVVADGPTAAATLLPLAARRPVIYNAHNLESAYRRGAFAQGLGTPEQLRRFERRLLEAAAESWMVSEADVQGARALAPGALVRYVPNVVDVAAIAPVHHEHPGRRALFLADFTYAPNADALRFLLDEVLPRVWEQMPDARLVLAGRGLDGAPSTDPRVERLGFVPTPADAYAVADCALVPLLDGGGSPLKFVEALAYGLPVVATPVAAAGLEVREGEHYVGAEGAEAFAAAVTRVLRHGAPELSARGRELARRRYSIEALTETIAA